MHIVAHMNDLANLGRQGTTDTSTTSRPGTLMFTIRKYFEQMTTIVKEPHVPVRLPEAIRNCDEETSVYK
jgi:hypothetical protein